MAHNPHAPQGPQGNQDPAGNTQMFRAFVDEGAPQRPAAQQASGGPKTGLIVGVIVALVVVAAVAWLALS